MIACGYSLHLYCDHPKHGDLPESVLYGRDHQTLQGDFSHHKKGGAFQEAREAGWTVRQKANKACCKHCRSRWGLADALEGKDDAKR